MNNRCLNCETPLQGAFCHVCGQENRDFDAPFRELVVEWLGNLFAFDARAWRTLRLLIIRPGFLTVEYVEGRRIRYVPPLRLYFFISILMFLVFALSQENLVNVTERGDRSSGTIRVFSTERPSEAAPESSATTPAESPGEAAEREFAGVVDEELLETDASSEASSSEAADDSDAEEELDLASRVQEKIIENPKAFNQAFLRNLPKALFLLVPVFAWLLWLFFRRAERRYFRHLIFSLHLHSFGFLMMILGSLVDMAWGVEDGPGNLAVFAVWVYFFLALRRVYGQSRIRTLIKLLAILFLYLFLTLIALLTLVGITLFVV